MDDDLRPALVALGAWLGFGAALDVILVHEGKRPITHALRTAPGLVFLSVLCLHVADVLGPADPFRRCARAIPRRLHPSPYSVTNGIPRRIGLAPMATEACPCPRTGMVP